MDVDSADVADLVSASEHYQAAAHVASRRASAAGAVAALLAIALALLSVQAAPVAVRGAVTIVFAVAFGVMVGSVLVYIRNRSTQRRAALLAGVIASELPRVGGG